MPQIQLTIAERKAHRAEAHHLAPVVMIGNDGLTPAVKKETDADQIDFNKKILHMSWHPFEDSIAIAATNNVSATTGRRFLFLTT